MSIEVGRVGLVGVRCVGLVELLVMLIVIVLVSVMVWVLVVTLIGVAVWCGGTSASVTLGMVNLQLKIRGMIRGVVTVCACLCRVVRCALVDRVGVVVIPNRS